ncbi:MAG: trypsin-like peptidase domain-containing protein [Lachnospiraceae bacterium]|nr:trypsin-like peptidase domain-containing protein [Lachnospiraceae bacterium]
MDNSKLKMRYNIMDINSPVTFANVKGGVNRGFKDVYFVRMVGVSANYLKDIELMDNTLTCGMSEGKGKYVRLNGLPKLLNQEDVICYTGCFEEWQNSSRKKCFLKFNRDDNDLAEALGEACQTVCGMFRNSTPNCNDSIEKNFVIKLLYWMDSLGFSLFKEGTGQFYRKVVLSEVSKKQEYLFAYFLTLLGIDVMLLLPEKDMEDIPVLKELSKKVTLGNVNPVVIPSYDEKKYETASAAAKSEQAGDKTAMPRVSLQDIRRERVHRSKPGNGTPVRPLETGTPDGNTGSGANVPAGTAQNRELAFEELALLASSVVMIAVRNKKGEVISTGSGIMVGRAGYILTNNHVACGGVAYSVRIEDDEQIYETDEIIKYNPVLDLAVIRIDRTLKPLPVYQGKKDLVRGQKVVAIGSPLGLFNSVSDGIISGFRKIDDVDMIQFTAPTSHGSSGGAVLNMFGEVIGISTAGFADGQNINLAVGYQNINNFVRGFT